MLMLGVYEAVKCPVSAETAFSGKHGFRSHNNLMVPPRESF